MPAPPPAEQPGSPEDLVRVLRAEGVRDRRVLAAFRAVSRAGFVPLDAAGQAYVDAPIRIPHGQVTTQPSLIAAMVAALGLTGSEWVLEVGTGWASRPPSWPGSPAGWCRSSASPTWPSRPGPTWPRPAGRVTVVVGDGTRGVPQHAPTRRSWSRPRHPVFRGRWSSSSPQGMAGASGRAGRP